MRVSCRYKWLEVDVPALPNHFQARAPRSRLAGLAVLTGLSRLTGVTHTSRTGRTDGRNSAHGARSSWPARSLVPTVFSGTRSIHYIRLSFQWPQSSHYPHWLYWHSSYASRGPRAHVRPPRAPAFTHAVGAALALPRSPRLGSPSPSPRPTVSCCMRAVLCCAVLCSLHSPLPPSLGAPVPWSLARPRFSQRVRVVMVPCALALVRGCASFLFSAIVTYERNYFEFTVHIPEHSALA